MIRETTTSRVASLTRLSSWSMTQAFLLTVLAYAFPKYCCICHFGSRGSFSSAAS